MWGATRKTRINPQTGVDSHTHNHRLPLEKTSSLPFLVPEIPNGCPLPTQPTPFEHWLVSYSWPQMFQKGNERTKTDISHSKTILVYVSDFWTRRDQGMDEAGEQLPSQPLKMDKSPIYGGNLFSSKFDFHIF